MYNWLQHTLNMFHGNPPTSEAEPTQIQQRERQATSSDQTAQNHPRTPTLAMLRTNNTAAHLRFISWRSQPPYLRCRPMSAHPLYETDERIRALDYGGKVLMPQSFMALSMVANRHMDILLLRIERLTEPHTGEDRQRLRTHCTIWDFSADENYCHLPKWIMQQLNLYPGYPVCVKFLETKPPVGKYIRLQPVVRGEYFNPCVEKLRSLLESQLKNYQVLTLGDVFTILDPVLKREFTFCVRQLKPFHDYVSIFECVMQLEFVEPQQLASTAIQNEHKLRPAINSDYKPNQLTFVRRSGYRSWRACDTDKGVGKQLNLRPPQFVVDAQKLKKDGSATKDGTSSQTRSGSAPPFTGRGHTLGTSRDKNC